MRHAIITQTPDINKRSMSNEPSTPPRDTRRRRLNRSSNVFNAFSQTPRPHYSRDELPLLSTHNLARLQNIADGVQKLQGNMDGLSRIHEALNNRFNEPFAGFLYGLLLNMFCSNYPACPSREQYESKKQSHNVLSLIVSLEERILLAKSRRDKLQEQVSLKTQELRILQTKRTTPARKAVPGPRIRPLYTHPKVPQQSKKVTVARDDTFSTMDLFIEAPLSTYGRQGRAQDAIKGKTPNLNQAPRYMRGLFESKSVNQARNRMTKQELKLARPETAAAKAERARRDRLATRPPFR